MPNSPTTDVVRMIFPCRCATMCGQEAFTVLTGPPRCTRQYCSKSSRVASSKSWLPQIPALFTRRSILPKCSMVVAIRSLPPSAVEMSLSFAIAAPPRDRMRSATCCAIVESFPNPDTSVPRSFTTTRAPRSARSSTYARPSPRPAPVTTATFPSNEIRSVILLSSCGDRLRGREAGPPALRAVAHAVALQRNLAVLQDQQPGRAAAGQVVAEAEAHPAHLKGQVRERTGVRWERPHRVAAPDDAHRPDLVLVAEGRRLVFGCRVQDVRSRPLRIGVAALHASTSPTLAYSTSMRAPISP